MKFNLFAVKCQNEECGHEFITNSEEHTGCPACGDNIIYSKDCIKVETEELFTSDIASFMSTKEGALVGTLLGLAYINGENIIARYDDNAGFRINVKNSEYTDKVLELINIKSVSEFKDLIEEVVEDAHESLIIDPILNCIRREHYYDEEGILYECGAVNFVAAKKFHSWLLNNNSFVLELLSK